MTFYLVPGISYILAWLTLSTLDQKHIKLSVCPDSGTQALLTQHSYKP